MLSFVIGILFVGFSYYPIFSCKLVSHNEIVPCYCITEHVVFAKKGCLSLRLDKFPLWNTVMMHVMNSYKDHSCPSGKSTLQTIFKILPVWYTCIRLYVCIVRTSL